MHSQNIAAFISAVQREAFHLTPEIHAEQKGDPLHFCIILINGKFNYGAVTFSVSAESQDASDRQRTGCIENCLSGSGRGAGSIAWQWFHLLTPEWPQSICSFSEVILHFMTMFQGMKRGCFLFGPEPSMVKR